MDKLDPGSIEAENEQGRPKFQDCDAMFLSSVEDDLTELKFCSNLTLTKVGEIPIPRLSFRETDKLFAFCGFNLLRLLRMGGIIFEAFKEPNSIQSTNGPVTIILFFTLQIFRDCLDCREIAFLV